MSSNFTESQRGATLIEVLIAVLVLSIGLLGALKLQTEGVRQNADSKYTVLASTMAHDALDAITFDRFADKVNWLSVDSIAAPIGCSGSPTTRAGVWNKKVACDLPDGKAKVDCQTTNTATVNACEVTIQWTPPGRDTVTATYKTYGSAAAAAASSSSSGG